MAISIQAPQKCGEGSETRLYGLTVFYSANLRVEYKGHESPRAPGNQAMHEMWCGEALDGVLCEGALQTMLVSEVRGVSSQKQGEDTEVPTRLVCEKQRSRFDSLQGVQQIAGGQRA